MVAVAAAAAAAAPGAAVVAAAVVVAVALAAAALGLAALGTHRGCHMTRRGAPLSRSEARLRTFFKATAGAVDMTVDMTLLFPDKVRKR